MNKLILLLVSAIIILPFALVQLVQGSTTFEVFPDPSFEDTTRIYLNVTFENGTKAVLRDYITVEQGQTIIDAIGEILRDEELDDDEELTEEELAEEDGDSAEDGSDDGGNGGDGGDGGNDNSDGDLDNNEPPINDTSEGSEEGVESVNCTAWSSNSTHVFPQDCSNLVFPQV